MSAHAQPIGDDASGQPGPKQTQTEPKKHPKPSADSPIQGGIAGVSRALETQVSKPEASPEENRARRDLAAQEGMAFWAGWMFWAALLQAILSAVGIGFIWRTLAQTRRATEAAFKAAAAAEKSAGVDEEAFKRLERPYIYLEIVSTKHLTPATREWAPRIAYTLVNYGKTPAIMRGVQLELKTLEQFHFTKEGEVPLPIQVDNRWYDVIAPGGKLVEERWLNVYGTRPGDKLPPYSGLVLQGVLDYQDATEAWYTLRFIMVRGTAESQFRLEHSEQSTTYPEDAAGTPQPLHRRFQFQKPRA